MKKLIILFMIPYTSIYALNSDKFASSRDPSYIPFADQVFYNQKEHGYFRIDCRHIGFHGYFYADSKGKVRASEKSNKMSCQIQQIKFVEDADGWCTIGVNKSSYMFHVNSNNDSWVSNKLVNKFCGRSIISSLKPGKDGGWLYKFKAKVQFPNKKIHNAFKCKAFEDNAGVEYTSKFQFVDLNCKRFVMI